MKKKLLILLTITGVLFSCKKEQAPCPTWIIHGYTVNPYGNVTDIGRAYKTTCEPIKPYELEYLDSSHTSYIIYENLK